MRSPTTIVLTLFLLTGIAWLLPATVSGQDIPVKIEQPKKVKSKRIKKKDKGDRARSNRRELRQARNKIRSKKGDKASKGDITGRKVRSKRTGRKTYARPTYDPYRGRKTFGAADRPAKEPPPDFRKPPRGEKPRKGDITGRKRIRTRSTSSVRSKVYAQPNARKRSASQNAERAARARKPRAASTRTASRPSERSRTVAVPPPSSVSGKRKIRRIRNPYSGHERRKGERATDRDIAGRKLRTRNTRSAIRPPKRGYSRPDTYFGRKPERAGPRFSPARMRSAGYVSGTRRPEQVTKGSFSEPDTKNYRSPRPATTPSFNPYAGRRTVREGERFRDTKPKRIRSASRKSERRIRVQIIPSKSISGSRKIHKPRSPYPGREQRAGERFTDRDIAGRKHRTRNYQSPRPRWGGPLARPDTYYGRKPAGEKPGSIAVPGYQPTSENFRASGYRGTRKATRPLKGGGSISGRMWNNRERAIAVKPPSGQTQMATQFQGRFRPFDLKPGYGDQQNIGRYKGRFRSYELQPGYGDQQNIGKYKGRFRPYDLKPGYGDQQNIGKYKGRFRPYELQPGYGDQQNIGKYKGRFRRYELKPGYGEQQNIGKYKGRFLPYELSPGYGEQQNIGRYKGELRAKKPLKGGGSISGRLWNNDERPLVVRGPGSDTRVATTFQGRMKARKPLKGGGSISGKLWNNDGRPIAVREPGSDTRVATNFQGRMKARKPLKGGGSISGKLWNNDGRPLAVREPGSDTRVATNFQGRLKATKPLKGGGSVSGRLWNNDEEPLQTRGAGRTQLAAMQFEGRFKTKDLKPGIYNDKKAAHYQGTLKGDNFFETYQKRRVAIKARRYQGELKGSVSRKPDQSEGTKIGKGWSLAFYSTPSVKKYGGLAEKHKIVSRKQLHPSYGYSQGEGRNSREEKAKLFKFKIWFTSIFKPNESQPKNVKSKHGPPRFDKREKDLWYE